MNTKDETNPYLIYFAAVLCILLIWIFFPERLQAQTATPTPRLIIEQPGSSQIVHPGTDSIVSNTGTIPYVSAAFVVKSSTYTFHAQITNSTSSVNLIHVPVIPNVTTQNASMVVSHATIADISAQVAIRFEFTATPTPTNTNTPTVTATATNTPTDTPTPTALPSNTPTPTAEVDALDNYYHLLWSENVRVDGRVAAASDPVNATDLVTKQYHDGLISTRVPTHKLTGTGEAQVSAIAGGYNIFVDVGAITEGTAITAYTAIIGDGENTEIQVGHGLNTRNVVVTQYRTTDFKRVNVAEVELTSLNSIALKYSGPPAEGEFYVIVTRSNNNYEVDASASTTVVHAHGLGHSDFILQLYENVDPYDRLIFDAKLYSTTGVEYTFSSTFADPFNAVIVPSNASTTIAPGTNWYSYTHNLGTRDLIAQVWDDAGNKELLHPEIDYTSENILNVTFTDTLAATSVIQLATIGNQSTEINRFVLLDGSNRSQASGTHFNDTVDIIAREIDVYWINYLGTATPTPTATVTPTFTPTFTPVIAGNGINIDSGTIEFNAAANNAIQLVTTGADPGHTHTDASIDNGITLDDITQITSRSHTALTDIGTNTHAQIDSHIADTTTNPHSVDLGDLGTVDISENTNLDPGNGLFLANDEIKLNTAANAAIQLVTTGANPGHTHTGTSLSSIDVSEDTNLAGGTMITLDNDTINNDYGTAINDSEVDNDITLTNITQITNRSHTNLSDVGSNTHAQIDSHLSNTSNPHSVSITQVSAGLSTNVAIGITGYNEFHSSGVSNPGHTHSDASIDDGITLTNITQITNRSHTNLSDIGTYNHTQIDNHIDDSNNPHSVDINDISSSLSSNTGLGVNAYNRFPVGDSDVDNDITLTNITQITNRSHTNLSNIGTNTHTQIDSHIANTSNPHSVNITDISADLSSNTGLGVHAYNNYLPLSGGTMTGNIDMNGNKIIDASLSLQSSNIHSFNGQGAFLRAVNYIHSGNDVDVGNSVQWIDLTSNNRINFAHGTPATLNRTIWIDPANEYIYSPLVQSVSTFASDTLLAVTTQELAGGAITASGALDLVIAATPVDSQAGFIRSIVADMPYEILPTYQGTDVHTLLHINGNANDSSGNGYTFTNFGSVNLSSAGKFQNSASFNGTNYLQRSNADVQLSGDFTLDFWLNNSANNTAPWPLVGYGNDTTATGFSILQGADQKIALYVNGATQITHNTAIAVSTWTHIAVTRSSNTLRLFVGGVDSGSTYVNANTMGQSNSVRLGSRPTNPIYYNGNIDEYHTQEGTGRWTSDFTPAESAYSSQDSVDPIPAFYMIDGTTQYVATVFYSVTDVVKAAYNPVIFEQIQADGYIVAGEATAPGGGYGVGDINGERLLTNGADYAEYFNSKNGLSTGLVCTIDSTLYNGVKIAESENNYIVGISTDGKSAVVGDTVTSQNENSVCIALLGKVTAQCIEPIYRGDLLGVSYGLVKKKLRPGRTIGIALHNSTPNNEVYLLLNQQTFDKSKEPTAITFNLMAFYFIILVILIIYLTNQVHKTRGKKDET